MARAPERVLPPRRHRFHHAETDEAMTRSKPIAFADASVSLSRAIIARG
jgi:hypothetical protein